MAPESSPRSARAFARAGRRALAPLLDLLLPADCFVCGRPLGLAQRHGACLDCWVSIAPLRPPLCSACGLPLPSGTDLLGPARGRCATCLLRPPSLTAVRAAVAYTGAARAVLLRAKIGRRPEILRTLGDELGVVLAASRFADGCGIVVPVPSHPWTRLRRGFDPAAILASRVARALALPVALGALARRFSAPISAKRLSARSRSAAVARAFVARCRSVHPRVLLVDDVMTTGATAETCASCLRSAGAREVRLAVWARTPRRAP